MQRTFDCMARPLIVAAAAIVTLAALSSSSSFTYPFSEAAEFAAVLLPKEDRIILQLTQSVMIKLKMDPGSQAMQRIDEAISAQDMDGKKMAVIVSVTGSSGTDGSYADDDGDDGASKTAESIVQFLNKRIGEAGSDVHVKSATFAFTERVRKDADGASGSSIVILGQLQITNITLANVASTKEDGAFHVVDVSWKNLVSVDEPVIAAVPTISDPDTRLEIDVNSIGGMIRVLDPALHKEMINNNAQMEKALASPILNFSTINLVPVGQWDFVYGESYCDPYVEKFDSFSALIKGCEVSSYSLLDKGDIMRKITLSAQTSEGPVDLEISSNPEVAQIFVGGYSRVENEAEYILTAGKKPVEGCSSDDRQDPLVPWHIDCITGAFQVNWSAVIVLGAVPVAVLGVLYILMHRKR